jgi:predicted transcriptional regulator YdeE
MEQGGRMNYQIITLPEYRAIGMKWDGNWQEIDQLKAIIQTMSERVVELEGARHPEEQLGLSYHTRPDGFIHYSCYEVTNSQIIPSGMVEIVIPELTYLVTKHQKGEDIGQTYHHILNWFENSQYKPYKAANKTYYDSLPIKHEKYPVDRDLTDPHFDILIPIIKK